MTANELMIGDWIRIDEPDKYAGATGQIQSLMYHREGDAAYFHVFIQGKFGFVSRDVCSDDIRPITLTPKILEKNEIDTVFKTRYKGFYLEYHTEVVMIMLYVYNNGFFQPTGIGFKYVHELQLAFRLAGIDKEIKLED